MDTLYIGDIPSQYHYAIFNNGYIDLYNTSNLSNGNFHYYRIYTNAGGFYYTEGDHNYSQYNYTTAKDVTVSSNCCYRTDFSNILTSTFIIALFAIFLFNIVTSAINKGGVLGGLL